MSNGRPPKNLCRWGWGGWVPHVDCSPPFNANGVVSPSPRLAEERGPPWVLIPTHHPTATRLWLAPSFATSRLRVKPFLLQQYFARSREVMTGPLSPVDFHEPADHASGMPRRKPRFYSPKDFVPRWPPTVSKQYHEYRLKEMPPGAIQADLTQHRAHGSYSPPMWYVDKHGRCLDCGCEFTFSAQEQKHWYEVLHIPIYAGPGHCRACRKRRRDASHDESSPDKTDKAGSPE
jgi:Probable zinc-ribbon domain